jgi:hypothetical protein
MREGEEEKAEKEYFLDVCTFAGFADLGSQPNPSSALIS